MELGHSHASTRMSKRPQTFLPKPAAGERPKVWRFSKLAPFFLINVLLLLLLFSPQPRVKTTAIDACYRHCPCLDYPSHQAVGRCDMTKQHTAKKKRKKEEKGWMCYMQTPKRFKRTLYLLGQNTTCDFSGQSPLTSYKTTLKQQLNGEKRWKMRWMYCSFQRDPMLFFPSLFAALSVNQ